MLMLELSYAAGSLNRRNAARMCKVRGAHVGYSSRGEFYVVDGKVWHLIKSGAASLIGDYGAFMWEVRLGKRRNFSREPIASAARRVC
jgi:hypothetical protein